MICKRALSTGLIVASVSLFSVSVFIWDLYSRGKGTPGWPMMMLAIDMLLVMQVPDWCSQGLVGVTVFWLLMCGVEESFRFGLFDIPGLLPQEDRREYFRELTDCAEVPCASKGFPPSNLSLALAVFVVDFIVTRGFARGVLKEQASMERTINAVQEIASLLAGYDVEKVAELLEEHEHELPEGMTVALRALEKNLRRYKAYLPQTCLPFEVVDVEEAESVSASSKERTAHSMEMSGSTSTMPNIIAKAPALGLASVKATLLMVNIKDTLCFLEEDVAGFSQLFTTLLLKTLKATESHRGMVDVFVGDRVHCSFNTSRQCANHATSALHAASTLMGKANDAAPHVNIGVATGKVLRGDMGCEVMRRFSMVGTLVRDVHGMERAGRVLGCDVLCNRLCFSEAECEHEMRLIPCKVEVSATSDTPEVVAELLPGNEEAEHETEEWMYQIGKNGEWENYNTAVRKYLKGDVSAAAVEDAEQGCPCERSPLNVHPSTVKGGLLSVALACTTAVGRDNPVEGFGVGKGI